MRSSSKMRCHYRVDSHRQYHLLDSLEKPVSAALRSIHRRVGFSTHCIDCTLNMPLSQEIGEFRR